MPVHVQKALSMKYLKRKAIRLLLLLILPLSLAADASRVKSAAEFPSPCRDDSYIPSPKRSESGGAQRKVQTLKLFPGTAGVPPARVP